jgi:hypothetical protein
MLAICEVSKIDEMGLKKSGHDCMNCWFATAICYQYLVAKYVVQHVAGHVEATIHPGHTVLFASGLV